MTDFVRYTHTPLAVEHTQAQSRGGGVSMKATHTRRASAPRRNYYIFRIICTVIIYTCITGSTTMCVRVDDISHKHFLFCHVVGEVLFAVDEEPTLSVAVWEVTNHATVVECPILGKSTSMLVEHLADAYGQSNVDVLWFGCPLLHKSEREHSGGDTSP